MAKKDTTKSSIKRAKTPLRPVKKFKIKKSNAGRKTKYHEDFPLLAQDYARQGMIDTGICKKLGISVATYHEYQKEYPEFLKAIKEGKKPVDVEVENALLKRALGFTYEEVHAEFRAKDKDDQKAKPIVVKKITKMVVPDTTACIFHLKNRRPGRWKDRQHFDLNGNLNMKVITAVPRPKKKKEKK